MRGAVHRMLCQLQRAQLAASMIGLPPMSMTVRYGASAVAGGMARLHLGRRLLSRRLLIITA